MKMTEREGRAMRLSALAATATAIALAGCAAAPVAGPTGAHAAFSLPETGQRLAEARCASCHAVGLDGASPMAEAPPFRVLHQRYPVDQLQEALAEGLTTAHPAMPAVELTPDEIVGLIAYLETLAPA